MDNNKEHLNNLSEIRSLMERSSTFISLSGLSGICAGIIGIIGWYISFSRINAFDVTRSKSEIIMFFFLLSAALLVSVFAVTIYFTVRKAKRKGLPVWNNSARRLVVNLFIPLIAGGVFCLILVSHELYSLIPAAMLLFYGLALLNAGKYTLHEISLLGISEIILGLLAAMWTESGLLFWALGFGIMNIVYGAVMYFKYER
jgi:membrane-associated HD superfamily phosphohydrolase